MRHGVSKTRGGVSRSIAIPAHLESWQLLLCLHLHGSILDPKLGLLEALWIMCQHMGWAHYQLVFVPCQLAPTAEQCM